MRSWVLAIAALSTGCGGIAAAAPRQARPAVRTIPVTGGKFAWQADKRPGVTRYVDGPVTVSVRGLRTEDGVAPQALIAIPGYAPVTLYGDRGQPSYPHSFTIARPGAPAGPYALIESFTGGAHCCWHPQLALPVGGRLAVVDFGDQWDGGGSTIGDLNHDGRVDLVQSDQAFYYAFTDYADSAAPSEILDVTDGHPREVSADPGFRAHFAAEAARLRPSCTQGARDGVSNGVCAAYVAASARAGDFAAAWRRMLGAYDRSHQWDYTTGCRVARQLNGNCPANQSISYRTFPEALLALLKERGYVPRDTDVPLS